MKRWVKRLFGAWILWKLFGPELTPRFPTGQRHPLRLPGRTVFVGDAEFLIRETGSPDKPPLILVHGWGDHSLVLYSKMIPQLAEDFRIIAVDNRNNGKSDHLRGRFEMSAMTDELAAIITQLELGAVSVFGYSMGGMIAQDLAYRYPHLVRHLMLGGTAGFIGSPTGVPVPLVQSLYFLGRAAERVTRSEYSAARTKYLRSVGAIAPEHARWYWTQNINRDPDVYWESGWAIARFDSREWLGRLTQPTLVIITCVDQLMPPHAQYDLAGRLKTVTTLELHDGRHEAPLTHPDRFTEAIIDFVAQNGDPAAHFIRLDNGPRVMARATGSFEVDLTPEPSGQPSGQPLAIARMAIDKTYGGDLIATGIGQMLSFVTDVEGSAGYTAMEHVAGSLHGRRGSFVLQHNGIMNRGAPQLSITVVPDSGTEDLTGLTGEMTIEITDGKHTYEFSYSVD